MFLFIFESIGTSELIMIGIIALIFLGPRRLPEIARKMGKIMAEFRATTSEFKETWEREVNFEEEAKALRSAIDEDPVPREPAAGSYPEGIAAPEIKEMDSAAFNGGAAAEPPNDQEVSDLNGIGESDAAVADTSLSEKKNWL